MDDEKKVDAPAEEATEAAEVEETTEAEAETE